MVMRYDWSIWLLALFWFVCIYPFMINDFYCSRELMDDLYDNYMKTVIDK